jgi:hypothetical protein
VKGESVIVVTGQFKTFFFSFSLPRRKIPFFLGSVFPVHLTTNKWPGFSRAAYIYKHTHTRGLYTLYLFEPNGHPEDFSRDSKINKISFLSHFLFYTWAALGIWEFLFSFKKKKV